MEDDKKYNPTAEAIKIIAKKFDATYGFGSNFVIRSEKQKEPAIKAISDISETINTKFDEWVQVKTDRMHALKAAGEDPYKKGTNLFGGDHEAVKKSFRKDGGIALDMKDLIKDSLKKAKILFPGVIVSDIMFELNNTAENIARDKYEGKAAQTSRTNTENTRIISHGLPVNTKKPEAKGKQ